MDLSKLFLYIFLGIFSTNFMPCLCQWGLKWGEWLPGSLVKMKPVKLIGSSKSFKSSRVVWRSGKHDLYIEHDSSDSSEDSDSIRRRIVRKINRHLSKRRGLNSRRKKANILIEQLIKDRLMRKSIGSNKINHTDIVKPPRFRTRMEGDVRIKPISKTTLADKVGDQLLSGYDYTTNVPVVTPNLVTRTGLKSIQRDINKHSGNAGPKFRKILPLGHSDIEEREYEEEEIQKKSKTGLTTTEIPETEESETKQQKRTTVSTNILQSTTPRNIENEIEPEDTTTQAEITKSIKQSNLVAAVSLFLKTTVTPNLTKQKNIEQEIEPEDTTTEAPVSTTKAAVSTKHKESTKQTTIEQEIEPEDTTTSSIATTKVTVSSTTNHNTSATGEQEIELEDVTTTTQPGIQATTTADQEVEAEETTTTPNQNHTTVATSNTRAITPEISDKIGHGLKSNITKTLDSVIPQHTNNVDISHPIKPQNEYAIPNKTFSFRSKSEPIFKVSAKNLPSDMTGLPLQETNNNMIKEPTQSIPNVVPKTSNYPHDSVISTPDKTLKVETNIDRLLLGQRKSVIGKGDIAIDKPGYVYSNIKRIQPNSLFNRVGSGRPRVVDNDNSKLHANTFSTDIKIKVGPTKSNFGDKEILQFNGTVFKTQQKFNIQHTPSSSQNDLKIQKGNIETDAKLNAPINSIGRQTKISISQSNVQNQRTLSGVNENSIQTSDKGTRRNKGKMNFKFQKHGVTYLQPSNELVHKNVITSFNPDKIRIGSDNRKVSVDKTRMGFKPNEIGTSPLLHERIATKGNIMTSFNPGQMRIGSLSDKISVNEENLMAGFNKGSMITGSVSGKMPVSKGNVLTRFNPITVRTVPENKPAVKGNKITSSNENKTKTGSLYVNKPVAKGIFLNKGNAGTGFLSVIKPAIKENFLNKGNAGIVPDNKPAIKDNFLNKGNAGTSFLSVNKPSIKENFLNKGNTGTVTNTLHIKNDIPKLKGSPTNVQSSWDRILKTNQVSGGIQNAPQTASQNSIQKQPEIPWGPVATSKPVFTNHEVIIQQPSNKISWKSPNLPVVFKQPAITGRKLKDTTQNPNAFKHTTGILHKLRKTINQTTEITKDLLERLRPQNKRNLGSNRGRLTISDAKSSPKVAPIPNTQTNNRIKGMIKSGETLTASWKDSMRGQAMELATEMEGSWKGSSPGIKSPKLNRSGKAPGTASTSRTGKDPITFHWSRTST